ncbi:redoxin domain-containing protein [Terrimonas rubra]|uniref:Redoxin domain-containing protein n=1 Tax=Terrimonas rubra TaxID=1035890 RepID=A0ABW6A628_9BACT
MMQIKKLPVLLFCCVVGLLAKAQQLQVSGSIQGLKPNTLVSLTDMNNPRDTIAKARVVNNWFVLKGKVKEPSLLALNLPGGKAQHLFVGNEKLKITGSLNNLAAWKYTGSATQASFVAFQKIFPPKFDRLNNYAMRLRSGEQDEVLRLNAEVLTDSIQTDVDGFIAKYTHSAVSPFLLLVVLNINNDVNLLEQRLQQLQPGALTNAYGKYLQGFVDDEKGTAIGSIAKDFTQADTTGQPVALSSFRGKYVLLDFWASWCGPCRQENPNVVRNFNKFKDKNFTVLGVSLDNPGQKQRWLDAIKKDNLTWTNVSDLQGWGNAVAQQYKVQGIPQNFLIGPDGKILAKNLRGHDLEARLCELLGCE